MNRTEFIQLIQDPDLPATRHVGALKQVVADFPYFTVSQVLLAKALHNEKHYEYEKYLRQTALIVPDREVLYYYLHNTAAPELLPVTEAKTPQPIAVPVITEEPVVNEQVLPEVTETTAVKKEPIVEDIPVTEDITATVEQVDTPDLIAISEHVLQPGEPATENPVNEPEQVEDPAAEDMPVTEEIIATVEQADTPDLIAVSEPVLQSGEPTAENPVNEPEPVTEEEGEEHSFMEWLMLKSGKPAIITITGEQAEEPALTRPEPVVHNEPDPEPVKPPVSVEVTRADIEQAVAKSNVNDFGNILDKFIRENPSISRPKAEFFNPVNMAKQSVEEDEELVTETLANLLYKQGNLKKAIRAYEKLCLLYPSKMTYFASLIQKIKTELKD
jgi:hypothetical protein